MLETNLDTASIRQVIANLYKGAGINFPTSTRPITSLGGLTGSLSLIWHEVPKLTSRSASEILLQQGGLLNPLTEVNDEKLAGFMYANASCGAIFVEQGDRLTRRRFSAAHELGHYLLHFIPLLEAAKETGEEELPELIDGLPITSEEAEPGTEFQEGIALPTVTSGISAKLPTYEQMEHEANEFAAEILMPEALIRELFQNYSGRFQGRYLVRRLAADLLVSLSAMQWRLRKLGYLPPTTVQWN
ncbi:MAG: ImmA/IrrE family metallo-endopeptidase [Chloroflexi bacterium]|uniref:ImmA/IrrE family metallo-endopeptidase n=1 Tax=Candidatus Chlorohelix allophototropha TaxID=3003348 RepID=A0A8T7M4L7_9CHLR|nr:ImmA/IrrE family metallo-endopeptidase [Chloroflexota bacterium]WJW70358.1 ImmA/IrrE family metallo-endopeptidase [Chloroflexota bacterium L227-S17]